MLGFRHYGHEITGTNSRLTKQMNPIFGANARFKILERGSHYLITLDVKASRVAQARWSAGIWKRVVQYANGNFPGKDDAANILALMRELGWSLHTVSFGGPERRALESGIVKEALEVRPQVAEILCWIAKPGENAERDRRAVKIISEHYGSVSLGLVAGRVVSRSFGADHFLDSISRFVYDSLQQMNEDLARLPEPSPIRICATQYCPRFFVRDGKHLHCEKHRGAKATRSPDENRRYKFIRDNLRTPIHKLEKKITSGRLASARDGAWKLKCVTQIHINRTRRIKKRPIDYLRIG